MRYPLEGKNVLVVGMARSGVAAVDLLRQHSATVLVTDSNAAANGSGISLSPYSGETFTSADLIVLSPGVPVDIPEVLAAKRKGIPVIGEVELAGYFLRGPIIGITGSNGKTTTTAMIGHILTESGVPNQVGGNIGTPPAAMIVNSREDQWNVLELSSFQLETIQEFRVRIAVGLNLTPDHLDRHGTVEAYSNAKARLFECQDADGFAVLNADDPGSTAWMARTKAQVHWFSRQKIVRPGAWMNEEMLTVDGYPVLPVSEIPVMGAHNVENTLAAITAAKLAGAGIEGIARGVRSFPGVEHRIEFVREHNGVRYYNDSKATNVDATEKAIDAFAGNLWIILGGKDKNSDYTVLRSRMEQKAKGILLIGAAAEKIEQHLKGLHVIHVETLDRAVSHAARSAEPGDIVLLAPACASFDQFQSYEHRGRVFKQLVKEL